MGSDQLLPSETIFEILTRINSLRSLDTFKAVSKEWNEIIHESGFMSTHCQRTSTISGYYVQDLKSNKYVSKFVSPDNMDVPMESLPKDTKILASSSKQGILCCEREIERGSKRLCQYFTYVPITRQLLDLPNPKTRYQTVAVAMMVLGAQPLRFKIIRLSKRGFIRPFSDLYKYGCEVFDSKTRTWRKESDILFPYAEFITNHPAVSAADSVYWLTTEANVLSYNIRKNSFNKFPTPKPVHENIYSYKRKQLIEYGGKLGFICLTEKRDVDVWVMKDIKNHTWKKEISVNIKFLERILTYPSPIGFYNAHVAFLEGGFNEVGYYKLQDSSFSSIKLGRLNCAGESFRFRSDIEPTNLSLV